MMGKRPEFTTLFIGQHVYRNRYPDACLFAIDEPIIGGPIVELNLIIRKERFEDLQSRISSNEFDPLTPCCIAMSDGMNWVFRGYPLLIAYEEDTQEGCISVKLRYPVTDLKRIKRSGTDEKNNRHPKNDGDVLV